MAAGTPTPEGHHVRRVTLPSGKTIELVYFESAEAINEQGNGPTAEAYAAVNAVRARAKVPALPEGLGYAQFRESLYWERLWELTQEHHGYFDAQRFWDLHVAAVRANSAQKGSFAPNAVPPEMAIQDHHRLFPIPQQAIDRNSELVQNPGY